tara:strand:+ start:1070 stop:1660 length:591 start_codon:yes stop_codon:yes gene_type:complete
MSDPNTLQAISSLRSEVADMFKSQNKSIDHRINTVIEQVLAKSMDFHIQTKKKAIEDITVDGPLSVDQLTQLYRQLMIDINDIKSNTTNYALYDQMQVVSKQFQQMQTDFNCMKKTLEGMVSDKYIEHGIKADELEKLYLLSGCSPDEVAKFLHVGKEHLYNILNGKEARPNEKRKHDLKQFLMQRIYKGQKHASV